MEKFANDNLILLEFLVDNVCFEYSVQKSLKCMEGETCVAFQFLDNAPLFVCEEDFAPKNRNYADGCGGCSTMKNGKSCLFALSPAQAQQCMKQFDIYVEVFRKMRSGTLPEKLILGESLISILNLFQEMVSAFNSSVDDAPTAKTLKDCFKIQNTSGELVGRIGVYIRMSTFGRLIVTQFQMNLKDKSVEFKAKEGHYLFTTKTKETDPGNKKIMPESLSVNNVLDIPCGKRKESEKRPCVNEDMKCPRPAPCPPPSLSTNMSSPGVQVGPLMQPPVPCPPQCPTPQCPPPQPQSGPRMSGVQFAPDTAISQGKEVCPPQCPTTPCPPPNTMPRSLMNAGARASPNYQNPNGFQGQCQLCGICPPQACPACGQTPNQNIQNPLIESPCEIFKRQLQANSKKVETPCQECDEKYQPPPVPPPPDCDYQEFGAEMGGNSLIIRVHKARVDECKDESCCCEPGGKPKPAVYQVSHPSPCNCSNQQAAAAAGRKEGVCPDCCPDNNTPFTFKMGGTTQADNQISVFSPNNNAQNGGKLCTLADPTKEVFILRIGKKNESASKKNNMEIELCTPKGKEYKPPLPKTDTEQQCEAQAEPKKGKKGKGGKGGKKGKGGKGGKGKGKKKK